MKHFTVDFFATELNKLFKNETCFRIWFTKNHSKFQMPITTKELIAFRKKQFEERQVQNLHLIPCKLERNLKELEKRMPGSDVPAIIGDLQALKKIKEGVVK